MPWLTQQDLETFHLYSFGTCRQCGATAELAASFVEWLNRNDRPGSESAATAFRDLAAGAKALQFALARVVRGRQVDITAILGQMEQDWADGMTTLVEPLWSLTPTFSSPPSGSAPRPRPTRRSSPGDLGSLPLRWIRATVPGTAAGALRDAGMPEPSSAELDGEDWWFRCRFPSSSAVQTSDPADGSRPLAPGAWLLELEGLATVADVWLNGVHLVHSEAMFTTRRARVEELKAVNELAIRFSALAPMLATRRPRPRWKTNGASHQNLRWFRTTLLGRQPGWAVTPAPVGPWRPIRLVRWSSLHVVQRQLTTRFEATDQGGTSGTVSVELRCTAEETTPDSASLEVAGASTRR